VTPLGCDLTLPLGALSRSPGAVTLASVAPGSDAQLEQELDRLYQLAPGDFTAARDELAKRLRAEDRRDLADEVKKLRKPPVAVWLVNRLAVEREVDVLRLVKIGEALAKGQAALAGGEPPEAFVEARREEEQTLARLATAAREVAGREGVGEAALPRVTATLRAASLSEEGRGLLRRGRLTEELEPPGFEALAGLTGAAARPKQRSKRADEQALERARDGLRRAQAAERKLVGAAQAARRKADEAASRAAELRDRAGEAEAAAAAATKEREAAEAELEGIS
jgi:hypothetical protein